MELESGKPKKTPKPPKPKHLVHIHENGAVLEDTFQTQLPDGDISSSPWRIRGARWQKPPKPPPDPPQLSKSTNGKNNDTSHGNDVVEAHNGPHSGRSGYAQRQGPDFSHQGTRSRSASLPAPAPVQSNHDAEFDMAQELADLPSDAFASSSSSPIQQAGDAILISSQGVPNTGARQKPNLKAPQKGLQQMTLFGITAPQQAGDGANKTKKHNWPLAQREEPPTHHKLDHEALKTYVYPTNLGTIRDYQFSIVRRGLFSNLLVALPTGLGKTFIAATIMLNWFRWTKDAQIIFVAPTKPLVSQQVEACFGIAGIPRSQTSMLTGGISPALRAEEWATKRVFFLTPQTIMNDLKTGICDPKRLVLLVVDEAHRATGNYAYVELVRFIHRFNQSLRVLALTATPGGDVEKVQEVINGLKISRVEIRTEFSIDIRQYVFTRNTEIITFRPSEEMELVMDLFSKVLSPMLQKLRSQQGYWTADPMKLTAYGLNQGRQKWMASPAGKNANAGIKGMMNRIFAVLASLAHNIDLLVYHGISPFYHNMVAFRNNVQNVQAGKYEREVTENEHFLKMMTQVGSWVSNDTFVGHPKLEHLQEVVLNHFMDAGDGKEGQPPSATRIMIFAHYRDSAEDIARVLRRNSPMIRPHVFVGQAASKGSEGMDQKKQLEVIHDFKTGKYNTLVATSIGEEGLDIGEIDLIICYDSSASPVRMLQRMGRTGRKRAGNILLLLMKGKEENSFTSAKDSYEKMQKMIADGNRFEFHEESARRIVPKGVEPVVDKRVVEIPPENSQAELPEPKKRGRKPAKMPKKKFHMPDGVRTGFTSASRMGGEDDSEDGRPIPVPRKRKQPAKLVEEPAPLPALGEVILTEKQEAELFRKYQDIPYAEGVDMEITRPALTKYPDHQRTLAPVHAVKHGRAATSAINILQAMHNVDHARISTLVRHSRNIDLDDKVSSRRIISSDDEASDGQVVISMQRKNKATTKTSGKATSKATTSTTKPINATAKARAPVTRKPTAAKKTTTTKKTPTSRVMNARQTSHNDAMEAASSSPPPTDPRLAMPTQGIDLGSDTSGDEEVEAEPSSDLRDFIVEGDEDIPDGTMTSSEDEVTPKPKGARQAPKTTKSTALQSKRMAQAMESDSDLDGDLPSLNTLIQTRMTDPEFKSGTTGGLPETAAKTNKRKKRVVEDSSD